VGQRLKIPGGAAPTASAQPPADPTPAVVASAVPEPAPLEKVYRVRPGDTLASIARRFGVSATDLAAVNKIRDPNQIQPGQVIELPGGSLTATPGDRSHAGVYTVRRGDNLDAIAAKFGVEIGELIALNGIRNKNQIRVGQTIYVPGPPEPEPGTAAAAPAAAVAAQSAAAASAPAPTTYTVQRGDTLAKIAARTGVSEHELVRRNGIRDKNRITPGQELVLRDAPPTAPAEAAPPGAAPEAAAEPAQAPTPPAAVSSGR
jgi:LysM repeat protein